METSSGYHRLFFLFLFFFHWVPQPLSGYIACGSPHAMAQSTRKIKSKPSGGWRETEPCLAC